MSSTDRSSVIVWMWLDCFCSSTFWARLPVRCRLRSAGGWASSKVARRRSTDSIASLLDEEVRRTATTAVTALRSSDTPWSVTLATRGTARMARSTRCTAARSAAVSGFPDAATNVASRVVFAPKGDASAAACTLGALDGRNEEFELFSTLESGGSATLRTTVTNNQPAMIGHRNRTLNRPRAANKRTSSVGGNGSVRRSASRRWCTTGRSAVGRARCGRPARARRSYGSRSVHSGRRPSMKKFFRGFLRLDPHSSMRPPGEPGHPFVRRAAARAGTLRSGLGRGR